VAGSAARRVPLIGIRHWVCVCALISCITTDLSGQSVPESQRSRAAIARVRPRLTAALSQKGLSLGAALYVRVFKQERRLEIWMRHDGRYELFKTYPICAYSGALGPKVREGDQQSPEGFYSVSAAQMHPLSRFHLSIDLGYPNAYDRANERTGSALMVHGSCVSVGCYAMTDPGIEEIYALADAALRAGQTAIPFHLFPFRPTEQNMRAHRDARWDRLWGDLKTAYDMFEQGRVPPRISVRQGEYVITPRP
jgi:murein L,D-transpeptidase YafK